MNFPRFAGAFAVLVATDAAAQLVVQSPPIDCFVHGRNSGLADAQAKDLCVGAISDEPADCYDRASRIGPLTDAYAVQLCTGAMSDEPVRCIQRVIGGAEYTTADAVDYCAALQYPLVVPPYGGSAACLDVARHTGLSDAQSLDVCRGSTTSAPAECVAIGRDATGLADADLVELCTTYAPIPIGGPGQYGR
jgi:hypothetical protein